MSANFSTNAGAAARHLLIPASALAAMLLLASASTAKVGGAAGTGNVPAPERTVPVPAMRADSTASPDRSAASRGDAKGGMELQAGKESTVFRTLTIEGEDRIHIDVERPKLTLDLEPQDAPGLDWGSPLDVLDRTMPDPLAPMLDLTARETSPWVARPWLSHFSSGPLARVRLNLRDVARWKLSFVDERGRAVATYSGNGRPPAEIDWDGRTAGGGWAEPGVTYSYVLEAHDRAGNKRNFVGEGFRTTSFRFQGPDGPVLTFTGDQLSPAGDGTADAAPPIVMEAATTLNHEPTPGRVVRVEVTARGPDQADAIARRVTGWLSSLLAGDPARIRPITHVSPDAPESGRVSLLATK